MRRGSEAGRLDAHRCRVVGGVDTQGKMLRSAEVLDMATRTFTAGPELGTARCFLSAVPLDSRHVLVVGVSNRIALSSSEVSLFFICSESTITSNILQSGSKYIGT